jgi:hypothetical protein
VNTSGQLKIRVEKILEESMVTRILDSVENAAASKPNIDKFITRFARVYTPFVVLFALFVAVVLPFILPDSLNWHFFVDSAYTGTVNDSWNKRNRIYLHSADILSYQLSMCVSIKCTAGILLWNRSRL